MVFNKEESLWERDKDWNLVPKEMEAEVLTNEYEIKEVKTGKFYEDKVSEEKFEIKERKKVRKTKKIKFEATILGRLELGFVLSRKSPEGEQVDDVDGSVILHCATNPKYKKEELKLIKKEYAVAIVSKILIESGLKPIEEGETKDSVRKAFLENEKLINYFLLTQTNIPHEKLSQLTHPEIKQIFDGKEIATDLAKQASEEAKMKAQAEQTAKEMRGK